jgi:hypothetical protein
MAACHIVYGTEPYPFNTHAAQPAVLYCVTHNSTMVLESHRCMIGRVEELEERVSKLEGVLCQLSLPAT